MPTTIDNVGLAPEDPLKMPPPYWRSVGAIFHVLSALGDLSGLLARLIPLHRETSGPLDEYFSQHPEAEEDDAELEEFGAICSDLVELEHRIRLRAELAIFMSAIDAEDTLNRFCIYNLHRDIAESLEKLSPPEKLRVASAVVGHPGVAGRDPYAALKRLSAWRNAFAHGHPVDRPTKSLRHSHLVSPPEYPGVPDTIATMVELLNGYLRICRYLESISLNSYTASGSVEAEEIEDHLSDITKYQFECEGSTTVYTVRFVG